MTKYLWSDDRMVNQHILADLLAKLLASRGVRHADTIPLAIATLRGLQQFLDADESANGYQLLADLWRSMPVAIKSMAWSASQGIALAREDDSVRLLDPRTGDEVYTGYAALALAWSADGRWLACACGDGHVRVWDTVGRIQLHPTLTYQEHPHLFPAWPLAVAWSPDGRWLASGGTDRRVLIWDAAQGETRYELHGHTDAITALAWAPSGRFLISGSLDRSASIWELETQEGRSYRGHTDAINAVAWSPDGFSVATAGREGSAQVWNPESGTLLLDYRGHSDAVTDIGWSADGTTIASAGMDATVQVWQALTGERLLCFEEKGPVHALAWSPRGGLAYEGQGASVRIATTGGGSPPLQKANE